MQHCTRIPSVTFKLREQSQDGTFEWKDVTTEQLFAQKNVVLLALPGAFTPTCSTTHLPGYEIKYNELQALGIDAVYCLSVNDAFVMNEWGKQLHIEHVTLLPDGSGEFTRSMGMLVKKDNLGFGMRSWRYSLYAEDMEIKQMFVEDGFGDDCPTDPFDVSDVDTMIGYLQSIR
jgi:peroxiredoxin